MKMRSKLCAATISALVLTLLGQAGALTIQVKRPGAESPVDLLSDEIHKFSAVGGGLGVETPQAPGPVAAPEGSPVAGQRPSARAVDALVDEAFAAQRAIIACLGSKGFFAHRLKPECDNDFNAKRLTLLSLLSQIAIKEEGACHHGLLQLGEWGNITEYLPRGTAGDTIGPSVIENGELEMLIKPCEALKESKKEAAELALEQSVPPETARLANEAAVTPERLANYGLILEATRGVERCMDSAPSGRYPLRDCISQSVRQVRDAIATALALASNNPAAHGAPAYYKLVQKVAYSFECRQMWHEGWFGFGNSYGTYMPACLESYAAGIRSAIPAAIRAQLPAEGQQAREQR